MTHYLLTVYIFTVSQGHGLSLDSYRDRILLGPYPTLEACNEAGEAHFRGFRTTVDPATQSRDMLGYQCDKVKE